MKLSRIVGAFVMSLALVSPTMARPLAGGWPPKHHEKKNPNRKKVHNHAKPAHRATRHHKSGKHG